MLAPLILTQNFPSLGNELTAVFHRKSIFPLTVCGRKFLEIRSKSTASKRHLTGHKPNAAVHMPNPLQMKVSRPFPQFVDNQFNPYFCRLLKNRF